MSFERLASSYLLEFQQIYRDAISAGATSVELASRPKAHEFMCKLWEHANNACHELKIRHESRHAGTDNTPDWTVEDAVSRGVFFFGDHKTVDLENPFRLSSAERKQIAKYLKMGRPVFIFDGIEFVFFETDELEVTERIQLIQKPIATNSDWSSQRVNPAVEAKFRQLLENPGFRQWTEDQLIAQVAVRARLLADEIYPLVMAPVGSGATIAEDSLLESLHKLHHVIGDHHDPSLADPRACADFIAQVLAFGLFFAHTRAPVAGADPNARLESINEFWKRDRYFQEAEKLRPFVAITNILLSDLQGSHNVRRIYEELGGILAHAEYQGTVQRRRDFHSLFETFFAEFDNVGRYDRGVFYTPEILTDWVVQFTDCLCEFHFNAGMCESADKIIDPCCGTGGFIESVGRSLGRAKTTNAPHLIGLEILPAPYALAHSRLAECMSPDLFRDRLDLFLVDTLSDHFDTPPAPNNDSFSADLARASELASPPLRIIIGNPPSSIHVASSAPRQRVESLMECFRPPAGHRSDRQNIQKALNNEAYRFLRWACDKVLLSDRGIVALVLPGAFLHSVSFRYARAWLLEQFQQIWVLELDADARTGSRTDSLFQVMQGRAVLFAVLNPDVPSYRVTDPDDSEKTCRAVKYLDVSRKTKAEKEQFLRLPIELDNFDTVAVTETDNRFTPGVWYPRDTWEMCWPLTEAADAAGVFFGKCSAVKLAPSALLFHTDSSMLASRCGAMSGLYAKRGEVPYEDLLDKWFKGQKKPPKKTKLTQEVCHAVASTVGNAETAYRRYTFRPYLLGWAVYDETVFDALNATPGGGTRARPEIAAAFGEEAVGLAIAPAPADLGATLTRFASFCWHLPDNDLSARGNAMIYADLFQPRSGRGKSRSASGVRENVHPAAVRLFEYSDQPRREVLFYCYAVLSSTVYLEVFEGILYRRADPENPFRVPFFAEKDVRRRIAEIGRQIAECEETSIVMPQFLDLAVEGLQQESEFRLTRSVISVSDRRIVLFQDAEEKARISEVPSEILNLRVAGHDVLKKWLRERQLPYLRRTFRKADLDELVNLINRIARQQALIGEIDQIIEPLLCADGVDRGSLAPPPPL